MWHNMWYKWINKMWYTYEMNYYLEIKTNEILIHASIRINLEKVMLSEIIQLQKTTYYLIQFYEMFRRGKSIETK